MSGDGTRGWGGIGRRRFLRRVGVATAGVAGATTPVAGATTTGAAQSDDGAERPEVVDRSPSSVTVDWTPPGNLAVDHYRVWFSIGEDFDVPMPAVVGETTVEQPPVTLDRLPADTSGTVRVVPVFDDESEGSTVSVETATLPAEGPAPPTPQPVLTQREDGPVVTWTNGGYDALAYYELLYWDTPDNPYAGQPAAPVRETYDATAESAPIPTDEDVYFRAVATGGRVAAAPRQRVASPPVNGDAGLSISSTTNRDVSENQVSIPEPAALYYRDATITGTILAPESCYRPVAAATYEDGVLTIAVTTERADDAQVCLTAVTPKQYEIDVDLPGPPAGVVVTYPDDGLRETAGDLEGPPRPTNLQVASRTPDGPVLSWDPVDDESVTHYRVAWGSSRIFSSDGADPADPKASIPTATVPTATLTAIEPPETVTTTDGSSTTTDGSTITTDAPSMSIQTTTTSSPGSTEWLSRPADATRAVLHPLAEDATYTVAVQAVDRDGRRSSHATIAVGPSDDAGVEPVVGGRYPRDLDGDGHYMDLSGNGERDFRDVTAYFQHMNDPVLTDHVEAYDYSGNGEIDYQDLIALFQST